MDETHNLNFRDFNSLFHYSPGALDYEMEKL